MRKTPVFCRPVVLFGPVADLAKERLAKEKPNLFEMLGEQLVRFSKLVFSQSNAFCNNANSICKLQSRSTLAT